MKHSSMKRILGATVALMMIGASLPMSASAAGFDWGGFAGGFPTTGNENIGSDAGSGGNAVSGLNAKIKNDMPTTVPAGAEQSSQCKVEPRNYYCKYTGKDKRCNVILPPNYNSSKKYPVMFVLHGIMGSENDMVNGNGVQELMTGLMASGQAEEFIVVCPNMFTSKTMNGPSGIDEQTCREYDNFLYDVTESLLPFIKENYSVKEGRENTAITGFSMGGREAIYCGLMRPDVFGYVGGACPAPGITPGSDRYMSHPGCMQESEMKFRDVGPEPEVFMITGGTNDGVVGTFPKQYSDILTRNGVNHVYQSIPGGGHDPNSVKPHLYTFMRYAFKDSGYSGGGGEVKPIDPDENGWYFHCGFEGSTDSFTGRGSAKVATSTNTASAGSSSLYVSGRESAWNGASYSLNSSVFKAGTAYSFSAMVYFSEGDATDKFHFTMQYSDSSGTANYTKIATETVSKGKWVQLANKNFKIPEGASNVQIYVETDNSTTSFYVDEVVGATAGTTIKGSGSSSGGGSDNPGGDTSNLYPTVQTQVKNGKIGLKWSKVQGAEKYGIGVYQANKWVVKKQVDGSVTTWTSPQVSRGTYRMVVLAKVNGQWVNADVFKKSFYVTVS